MKPLRAIAPKHHCGVEFVVVRFIGWGLILCILGGILLSALTRGNADWVKDVALVLAGGLGALLTNARGGSAQPVTVENPPSDPVPTVQAPDPVPIADPAG